MLYAFGLVLALIVIFLLFSAILLWGAASVALIFLPIMVAFSASLIGIFFVIILPLSFVKKYQGISARMVQGCGYIIQSTTILLGLAHLFKMFGLSSLAGLLVFNYLGLIASICLVIKGFDQIGIGMLLWSVASYGINKYGQWLTKEVKNSSKSKKASDNIIDVDGKVID